MTEAEALEMVLAACAVVDHLVAELEAARTAQRVAVQQASQAGATYEQIAAVCGCSSGTIKRDLRIARTAP